MSWKLTGKPFENELKKIVDIYNNKSNQKCDDLRNYLDKTGQYLSTLRDSYNIQTNFLHLLASDVKKGIYDNTSEGGYDRYFACDLFNCETINDNIKKAINCIYNNIYDENKQYDKNMQIFFKHIAPLINEETKYGKTPEKILEENNTMDKITRKNLGEIFDILKKINGKKGTLIATQNPTPTPAPAPPPAPPTPVTAPAPIPPPTPVTAPTPTPADTTVSVTTTPTPNDELEIFHDTNDPIHIDKSDNRGLATLVTSILKGLGKPNTNKPIKGGAPDDGLASLIVSVLKALSNKDGTSASPTDTGAAGAGSKFSSLFNFGKKTPGDPTDLLINNDILDIILNIANNEPLPKEEGNMKAKLLSGIGSLTSAFGSLMPKPVSPTSPEIEKYVPVSNTECKPNTEGDYESFAMIDNECIGSEGTQSEKMTKQ